MNYSIIKEALEIGLQEVQKTYAVLEHNFPWCRDELKSNVLKIQKALEELDNHFTLEAKYIPCWNSSATYCEPTYVMYGGKLCVIKEGMEKPCEIPKETI